MRLSREEAVAAVTRELEGVRCLMCAVMERAPLVVGATQHAVALLPRYALVPGHVVVTLRRHVTRFSDIDTAAWLDASRLALEAARIVEEELLPARCYVASLGTAQPGVPMSSPHLHQHVVPVADPASKPSTILTWERGVERLDDDQALALVARLRPGIMARLGKEAVA